MMTLTFTFTPQEAHGLLLALIIAQSHEQKAVETCIRFHTPVTEHEKTLTQFEQLQERLARELPQVAKHRAGRPRLQGDEPQAATGGRNW